MRPHLAAALDCNHSQHMHGCGGSDSLACRYGGTDQGAVRVEDQRHEAGQVYAPNNDHGTVRRPALDVPTGCAHCCMYHCHFEWLQVWDHGREALEAEVVRLREHVSALQAEVLCLEGEVARLRAVPQPPAKGRSNDRSDPSCGNASGGQDKLDIAIPLAGEPSLASQFQGAAMDHETHAGRFYGADVDAAGSLSISPLSCASSNGSPSIHSTTIAQFSGSIDIAALRESLVRADQTHAHLQRESTLSQVPFTHSMLHLFLYALWFPKQMTAHSSSLRVW